MLSPAGNPNSKNFFEILRLLQDNEGVELSVIAPATTQMPLCIIWPRKKPGQGRQMVLGCENIF
jgi:hypothetical protein